MKLDLERCRTWIRLGGLLLCVGCLLTASILPTAVHTAAASPDDEMLETICIYVDETRYRGRSVLYEDTTYVELGEFTDAVYPGQIRRNETTRTVEYTGKDLEISATEGKTYLCANGRYLWCPDGIFMNEDSVYVPVRALVKALGGELSWCETDSSVHIQMGDAPIAAGETFYAADDVLWLSRIIYAEAGIEPFEGQIAVGNVVLNRVREKTFPDTIYQVIFDRSCGVQFSPTANGAIYCIPDEDSIIAAKLCLEGYTLSEEILYFINSSLATNFWVPQNCQYIMTISGHDFYA